MDLPASEADLLRRLAAIEEIKALKYRYWRACDAKDVVGFRDCFALTSGPIALGSAGTFDHPDDAAAAFDRFARQRQDGELVIFDMHHGLHPVIEVANERSATGTWTLRFRQVNTAARYEFVSTGEYQDTYLFENERWLIHTSLYLPGWSLRRPISADIEVGVEGAWSR